MAWTVPTGTSVIRTMLPTVLDELATALNERQEAINASETDFSAAAAQTDITNMARAYYDLLRAGFTAITTGNPHYVSADLDEWVAPTWENGPLISTPKPIGNAAIWTQMQGVFDDLIRYKYATTPTTPNRTKKHGEALSYQDAWDAAIADGGSSESAEKRIVYLTSLGGSFPNTHYSDIKSANARQFTWPATLLGDFYRTKTGYTHSHFTGDTAADFEDSWGNSGQTVETPGQTDEFISAVPVTLSGTITLEFEFSDAPPAGWQKIVQVTVASLAVYVDVSSLLTYG